MSRTRLPDGRDHARHPALISLVIDLIPDETRAEIETAIDAPLVVERDRLYRDTSYNQVTVGRIGGGKTFDTKTELLADLREGSASGNDAGSDSGSDCYD